MNKGGVCEEKKNAWMLIIAEGNESWDVEMIHALRKEGMNLTLLQHAYKLYHAEKAIRSKTTATTPSLRTPSPSPKSNNPTPNKMIYHLYNPGSDVDMSPMQRFDHAIKVRNRSLGPVKAVKMSPYLNVEVSRPIKYSSIYSLSMDLKK